LFVVFVGEAGFHAGSFGGNRYRFRQQRHPAG